MKVIYFDDIWTYDFNQWKKEKLVFSHKEIKHPKQSHKGIKLTDSQKIWVGPGKVYVDLDNPIYQNKNFASIIRRYLYKGCSLLIIHLPLNQRLDMKQHYHSMIHSLPPLAIDYAFVPRIPLKLLQSDVIRYFWKEKVAFIIVDINQLTDLKRWKWEWIKHTQSLFPIPIYPIFHEREEKCKKEWRSIKEALNLLSVDETNPSLPLKKDSLRITGISPHKGELLNHSSTDFNIFHQDQTAMIEEPNQLFYHKAIPNLSFLKGELVKQHYTVYESRCKGEHIRLSKVIYFAT